MKFGDYLDLVEAFGFVEVHTRGSHRIYRHPEVEEAMSIQSFHGEAKPYQIRQFLELVELYDLQLKDGK